MNVHYNMVFEPKHMSAKCLPKEVKDKIYNFYSGEQPEYVKNTLDFIMIWINLGSLFIQQNLEMNIERKILQKRFLYYMIL